MHFSRCLAQGFLSLSLIFIFEREQEQAISAHYVIASQSAVSGTAQE